MLYFTTFIFLLSLVLGTTNVLSVTVSGVIALLSFVVLTVCIFSKPKYKKRVQIASYELLPIVPGVYAIRMSDNRVVCKYVDYEEEEIIQTNVLGSDTDIIISAECKKICLDVYVREIRNKWMFPGYYDMYIKVLNVPEGSVIGENAKAMKLNKE